MKMEGVTEEKYAFFLFYKKNYHFFQTIKQKMRFLITFAVLT
jgi:hypothetical protein